MAGSFRRATEREREQAVLVERRGGGRGRGEVRVEVGVAKRANTLVVGPTEEAAEAISVHTVADDGWAVAGDLSQTNWAVFAFD